MVLSIPMGKEPVAAVLTTVVSSLTRGVSLVLKGPTDTTVAQHQAIM